MVILVIKKLYVCVYLYKFATPQPVSFATFPLQDDFPNMTPLHSITFKRKPWVQVKVARENLQLIYI
jgi:hypothetical protein